MDMNKILDIAYEKDASDIHLICNNKPILRIARTLVPIEEMDVLTPDDMNEMYDYLVMGNVEKDEVFNTTRKLDTSYEYKGVRLRVNISLSDDVPLCTLRIIKNELPSYESLGVPDVVRRMTYQPQGVMLVTGKTNSGKTTTLNALINDINENQNRKILTLENPVEYKHHSKKSLIVQKEVGKGQDVLTFSQGVKNSLREDCDILVIGEIRDKETMEAAIEMAESGHLVIGTLHTKSCAETIDRMINFYEVRDQAQIKYLLSSLLKLVVSQRLLKGTNGKLVLVPEVMVVDNIVSGVIRKDKLSVSEIEDAIQSNQEKGSIGLINSLAKLFVEDKITLAQAKEQIEEKNIEEFRRRLNVNCTLTDEELRPKIVIDVPMPVSYITKELVEQISLLEPFGKGNTKPVFAQKNLRVLDHSIIGKNKNVVKLKLLDPQGISVEGIYFGEAEDFVNFIREKDSISVTYYPEINRFRGRESLQIIIQNYC